MKVGSSAGGPVVLSLPRRSRVDLSIDALEDVDGDGVLDIIDSHTYWRGDNCFGMSGTPGFGNPSVLWHALPEGGLSATDPIAAAFLRKRCSRPPAQLLVGGDIDWEVESMERIACARAWGSTADEVIAQIRREWASLDAEDVRGERSCNIPRAAFEKRAHIDPPVTLR